MQEQRYIQASKDGSVLTAWQEGVTEAAQSSDSRHQLLRRERELLPQFTEHYNKLKSLPRRARRAMQKKWKKSLAGVALLLALGGSPAVAATIPVGVGGCTLVDAITAANTDTPTGNCPAGDAGADIITLPTGSTQTLSVVNNETYYATGLPVITSEITIQGNGSTIMRDGAEETPEFRIFAINGDGNLTLQDTTVSGGLLTEANSFFFVSGGGVFNLYGNLTLTGSTVSGNVALLGGGVSNLGGTVTAPTLLFRVIQPPMAAVC